MSPDHRDTEEPESEPYEIEPPRSVFSALWFRVVLVVIVVGVVAAVAVPYVLEWMSPAPKTTAARPGAPAPKPPAAAAQPPAAPAPMPAVPAPAPAATAPEKKAPPAATALAPAAPQPSAPPIVKAPAPTPEEKPATPAKRASKPPARRPAKAAQKAPAAGGAYFVQVGAFTDPEHARRVAARLRADRFRVEESTAAGQEKSAEPAPAPEPAAAAGGDKYDVFVTGAPAADINAKLSAKGLATAAAGNGVVVKPSLPLRDAVALSKDLAVEGLKVQVRRAPGAPGAARAPTPPPAAPGGGEGLHRVRVGPFSDRAAATEALNALRDKGYKDSFIARGGA